jgi:hypothetical protein
MSMKRALADGLTNIVNKLTNRRNPHSQNTFTVCRMGESEMRAIYRTGIGQKIFNIKSGAALNDTLQFPSDKEKKYFNKALLPSVKQATKFMLGFGRGVIVINEIGNDLSKPLSAKPDFTRVKLDVFSGDMVYVEAPSLDLRDLRYMKPKMYMIRGHQFHWTRVIDFTYVKPAELDLPQYQYGGISESELIREQLINDGIVARAAPRIVDVSSTLFHKVKGFKESVATGKDDQVVAYTQALADIRGIWGDGIIDAEDDVVVAIQSLSNLADIDMMTIRRLSMVTGIDKSVLIGEQPAGLGGNGAAARAVTQDTIENLQSDFLIEPISRFCEIFGMKDVCFRENQGATPNDRMDFEAKAIDNAVKLSGLGEDSNKYLVDNDVVEKEDLSDFFKPQSEKDEEARLELEAAANLEAQNETPTDSQ